MYTIIQIKILIREEKGGVQKTLGRSPKTALVHCFKAVAHVINEVSEVKHENTRYDMTNADLAGGEIIQKKTDKIINL